ncbi:diaminopimelate epimerase [Desulfuromonas acetoxidans]|uniref:Diaminopimelate epimerase n=1 Tax=Desulfuromonas acetoxidans (strain DSM 684 / 11070) TaxID=281689 RepID=Q1K3Q6_DESA6|nr:diaminopimelate epimerase [Desulfuromonas acetoxidans]EAT16918.1 Diaminopimelate epimerase [Desulfuromonas acetoxidans DSM 684]MBF0644553.1 diaminopimelate epimerase [Desulfuromonas acetoxidans]NVD23920.1 diaminopimelate epimerase [Desulfuromonas acetoxidans]NVE16217.1 diaminopimelate epimerase [Desulfuromonas acetoxidans]
MKFIKMHGAGNDYVYVDGFQQDVHRPEELAVRISDRHFGVGSDGLILILPSDCADARMRMFNADGSEAQMCGNGIRCVAKYLCDQQSDRGSQLTIETLAGVLSVDVTADTENPAISQVTVNMGQPRLQRGQIPMTGPQQDQALEVEIRVKNRTFTASCVSMGNPHCVVYVDDVEQFDVAYWGALLENHPLFPERINVEFVEIISGSEVRQRTWERGAGETLACGTGASAVTVAGFLTGRTQRTIRNHLRGGVLTLEYCDDETVMMTGPAEQVFTGDYPWPEA